MGSCLLLLGWLHPALGPGSCSRPPRDVFLLRRKAARERVPDGCVVAGLEQQCEGDFSSIVTGEERLAH